MIRLGSFGDSIVARTVNRTEFFNSISRFLPFTPVLLNDWNRPKQTLELTGANVGFRIAKQTYP